MIRKLPKKFKLEEKNFPKKLKDINSEILSLQTNPLNMDLTKLKDDQKRYNEDFIRILGELHNIMLKQGEVFRAKAYKKAQDAIIKFQDSIYDPDKQLKSVSGIGSTILIKLNEFIDTGTLAILERERSNPLNLFTEIYGIGPKKAKELITKQNLPTETVSMHTFFESVKIF